MKKNNINTIFMIPLLRQTLRHDLFHIRPLISCDNIETELVTSLIELKETSIDLLPVDNDAVRETISTPPKSYIKADYYDKLSRKDLSQYTLLKVIENCERNRLDIIKVMMNDGVSPELNDTIKKVYDKQRTYLSTLQNKAVRP